MIKVTKENPELLELVQAAAEIYNGAEGNFDDGQVLVLSCDVMRLEKALNAFDFPRETLEEHEEAVQA